MKKVLLFLILLFPLISVAQSKKSLVRLKDGTEIKGVIKAIDPTDAVTLVIAGIETKIKMDNVSAIEEVDNDPSINGKPLSVVEKVVVEDPLKNYKGFLLSRGNNVYVYYSNTDYDNNAKYDKEGGIVIRALLKSDGFWNVVDDMNQAHFTINYCVDTNGHDVATLSISSWRTGKSHLLAIRNTNESVVKNNVIAHDFYLKAIKSLQKKIDKGAISKKYINDFTIK